MPKFTVAKLNRFLLFKLPSAYISGVRVTELADNKVTVKVKHNFINKNPFKSMFWAVQGMASELTTGVLVMKHIYESGQKISMLVTHQTGDFYKKATGRITFSCEDGQELAKAIAKTIETKEGQTIKMTSKGVNEDGIKVSSFTYLWSVKAK